MMNQPQENKALLAPPENKATGGCNCPHRRGIIARNCCGHAFDCPQYVNSFRDRQDAPQDCGETDDETGETK